MYQLLPIQAQYEAEICAIIKPVGAQDGAVGEGFGCSKIKQTHIAFAAQNVTKHPDKFT